MNKKKWKNAQTHFFVDMLYQWRELADEFSAILMTEAYSDNAKDLMLYYGDGNRNGAHFTFNFWLITQLNKFSTARDFKFIIEKWFSYMPVEYVANWVVGHNFFLFKKNIFFLT